MRLRRITTPQSDRINEVSFLEAKKATALFDVLGAANPVALGWWRHSHVFDPFWRIYYNFEAGAYITHGRKKILLGPNRFVIVPANVLFDTFLTRPTVNHFYMHFTMTGDYQFPQKQPIVLPSNASTKKMMVDLAGLLIKKRPNRICCHQRCLALLHYLFASVFRGASFRNTNRPGIARVVRELEKNPNAFMTVSQMAVFAGMSNRNFQRHFHQAMGLTPLLFLNETRLREAARQLIHSSLGIDEIAANLGFANRFHFSRLFRLFLGTPPAAFRRNRLPLVLSR